MNPRLFLLILLAAGCLFAAWAHGAPTPVKQATQLKSHTAAVIVSTNPPAVAGLWLTWQPPTNACYVVMSSPDLVTWTASYVLGTNWSFYDGIHVNADAGHVLTRKFVNAARGH